MAFTVMSIKFWPEVLINYQYFFYLSSSQVFTIWPIYACLHAFRLVRSVHRFLDRLCQVSQPDTVRRIFIFLTHCRASLRKFLSKIRWSSLHICFQGYWSSKRQPRSSQHWKSWAVWTWGGRISFRFWLIQLPTAPANHFVQFIEKPMLTHCCAAIM